MGTFLIRDCKIIIQSVSYHLPAYSGRTPNFYDVLRKAIETRETIALSLTDILSCSLMDRVGLPHPTLKKRSADNEQHEEHCPDPDVPGIDVGRR